MLDTSNNPCEEDSSNENDGEQDEKQDEIASNATEDDQQPLLSTVPSSSSTPKNLIKKRKRTKDEKIKAIFTEQEKEEREFQLKMMSMLYQKQGSRAPMMPDCYGPAYQPFEDSQYN